MNETNKKASSSAWQGLTDFAGKLPSIVWVVLLPLLLIALIGGIILIFYLLANVEGFASILMLLVTFYIIRWISMDLPGSSAAAGDNSGTKKTSKGGGGFALAAGIVFFALMGMAVDQPGNYLYNKPLDILFCKEDSRLEREVIVTHPLPERTDMTQGFYCVRGEDEIVKTIEIPFVLLVRFVEYVILGYLLVWLSKIYSLWKGKRLFSKA